MPKWVAIVGLILLLGGIGMFAFRQATEIGQRLYQQASGNSADKRKSAYLQFMLEALILVAMITLLELVENIANPGDGTPDILSRSSILGFLVPSVVCIGPGFLYGVAKAMKSDQAETGSTSAG